MFRNLYLLLLTALPLISYNQSRDKNTYGGYIKFEQAPAPEVITVTCTGFGTDKAESMKDASKELLNTLLFTGVPGSQYEMPLIPDIEKKHDSIITSLLSGRYLDFIISDELIESGAKNKRKDGVKGVMTVHRITINCGALIRYLEKKGIIRKFGI